MSERASKQTQRRAAHAYIHTYAHKRAAVIDEKAEPDASAAMYPCTDDHLLPLGNWFKCVLASL